VHLVAFDVLRGPDGAFRVVGTRTQAPSGAGYALANRLIVSRLLRDSFRDLRVRALGRFFHTLRKLLASAARPEEGPPHVVLLTPGPYNETYFEHAYLARTLGFTLCEGSDLTVREDRVYLKTLAGLERVHAILRRLDDDYCDPLELREDSTLGVTGLLQAWRAGEVLVANAFGTGVLETPALYGFLPAVCERLLGEPLRLPSVPTWWTGEAAALEAALPRLDEMVVKPAFPDLREEPAFGAALTPEARSGWESRLRGAPERYVLEQYLPLSHAPVFRDGRVESRAVMLRALLVADGRGDYEALPGGLTRVAGEDERVVSGQRGGATKETWVLSETAPERHPVFPEVPRPEATGLEPLGVSSRVGENLFWLGRYAERAQNGARLLRSVLSRLPDDETFPEDLYPTFVRICHRQGLVSRPPEAYTGPPRELERDLVEGLVGGGEGPGLTFDLRQAARAAMAVRARLSGDQWRVLNRLGEPFQAMARTPAGVADALVAVDRTIVSLAALSGLEMSHMIRDEGWRLLGLGRLVERLVFVTGTTALAAASHDHEEPALIEWLLDLFDLLVTYRARSQAAPEWAAALDLLLFDRTNPRSPAFLLAKLVGQASRLAEAEVEEVAQRLRAAAVRTAGPRTKDLLADPPALVAFLTATQDAALRLSDALNLRYFSHVSEPRRALAAW
jgi:uncharacterized circularly permuted ATP-grasp superfamily protein/uncharacterized alpha-E superfamily protein